MGGSALKQLKTALRDQNLERKDYQKDKKGKQKQKREIDPASRSEKLDALHNQFNTFDLKFIKRKHEVGQSRKTAGSVVNHSMVAGKPALAKSSANESRRKTLLPELLDRKRTGGVVDRRFGENNPHLTPEERALERFTAERQRLATGKGQKFNLAEEDELTHYGRSLALDEGGTLASQNDAFEFSKVAKRPLEDGEEDEPERKKSRTEIMNEVIAKSKAYKYERQKVRTEDDELRFALDDDLDELRVALGQAPQRQSKQNKSINQSESEKGEESDDVEMAESASNSEEEETDSEQDAIEDFTGIESVSESGNAEGVNSADMKITFVKPDADAAPVDKELLAKLLRTDDSQDPIHTEKDQQNSVLPTPTEDSYDSYVRMLSFEKRAKPSDRLKTEVEQIKEAAEALKKAETARLRRMEGLPSDDEDDSRNAKRRKVVKASQADDLDDDFDYGQVDDVLEADTAESGAFKLANDAKDGGVDDSETGESGDEEEDDLQDPSEDEESLGEVEPLIGDNTAKPPSRIESRASFVMKMPTSHSDFSSVVEELSPEELDVSINRIRTLYHPRLAEENNDKMAGFAGILLDHVIFLAARSEFNSINKLTPHVLSLAKAYPLASAKHFTAKLALMQKNFVRGLQDGPLEGNARTWPGAPELALFRITGLIWSTSDFSHPVAAPALLLICQYLSQSRLRSQTDLSSGLFLCTLAILYEGHSKRIIPEVLNFLAQALLILSPNTITERATLGGKYVSDAFRQELEHLKVKKNSAYDAADRLQCNSSDAGQLPTMLATTLSLVQRLAELYVSQTSFIEAFEPISGICSAILVENLPTALKTPLAQTKDALQRMLNLAAKSRRPLRLQHFRPVPIATYAPKFEESYRAGSRPFDPDTARTETSKLKAMLKKEKKGAVRELRKDNRFIAQEKSKMRATKDAEYRSKITAIKSGLQVERSEEKNYERTKQRLRTRDKKRSGRS